MQSAYQTSIVIIIFMYLFNRVSTWPTPHKLWSYMKQCHPTVIFPSSCVQNIKYNCCTSHRQSFCSFHYIASQKSVILLYIFLKENFTLEYKYMFQAGPTNNCSISLNLYWSWKINLYECNEYRKTLLILN